MNKSSSKLTVYFDDSFWIGVFERVESGKLSVCKVTIGAESKDCEDFYFADDFTHSYKLILSGKVTFLKR